MSSVKAQQAADPFVYLNGPRSGEHGVAALRTPIRVPKQQDTSAVWGAAHPFLAEIVGAGKSALAKALYTRSIAFGRRVSPWSTPHSTSP